MILAIDIGNTNIVIGGIDEKKTYFIERVSTIRTKTELEYAIDLLRDDGLRRIHNGQGRLVLFDQPQYCGQVGGGGQ